jgi:hypothetical protein
MHPRTKVRTRMRVCVLCVRVCARVCACVFVYGWGEGGTCMHALKYMGERRLPVRANAFTTVKRFSTFLRPRQANFDA